MKPDLPKHLKLCRMGDSLYLTIPKEFVRAHTLGQHDYVFWSPEPDGIKLKFESLRHSAVQQVNGSADHHPGV